MSSHLLLLGASGYTGRLVAAELAKRGVEFVACGRDVKRVERALDELGISARVERVDATEPSSLGELLDREKPSAVITTIGPFLDLGKPVALAVAESGASYMDSCGEQAFIKWLLESVSPSADGQLIVPSLAFEYALADAGAELLKDELGEPLDIRSFYYLPSSAASRGTRVSMVRAMEEKVLAFFDGELREVGRKVAQVSIGEPERTLDALIFPAGEPVMIPRRIRARSVESYMVMSLSAARMLYRAARDAKDRKGAVQTDELGPAPEQRKRSRFFVVLEGVAGERSARLRISGTDPYGLTAHLLAEGAVATLDGEVKRGGVCTPSEAFGAERIVSWCKSWGVSFALET